MNQSIGGVEAEHISRAELLSAVADPLRLGILAVVLRPRPVQEICAALGGVAQPRVSHHLAVLREQGLVCVERRGRQRLYGWAEPGPGPRADLLQLLSRWLARSARPSIRPAADDASRSGGKGARAVSTELEDFLL